MPTSDILGQANRSRGNGMEEHVMGLVFHLVACIEHLSYSCQRMGQRTDRSCAHGCPSESEGQRCRSRSKQ